ncbi:MAG TPA: hypothetical protein VKT72_10710 [Candidatus Baltobacteraceae bacterium]|nr:hypothetical protein [Candidatus Baltobacteraceae bacterium]
MVANTDAVTTRLGSPSSTVERGTIDTACTYVRKWRWPCGCQGEIIAGSLIDVTLCEAHK